MRTRRYTDPVPPRGPGRPLHVLIHHDGQTHTLSALANSYGMSPQLLYSRLYNLHWPLEKALNQAVRQYCRKP